MTLCRLPRISILASSILLLSLTSGRVSAGPQSAAAAKAAKVSAASAEYDKRVETLRNTCIAPPKPTPTPTCTKPALQTSSLCQWLKPGLHQYVVMGGNVSAAAIGKLHRGVDEVWDLYNQQFAAFTYTGDGIASVVGISASGYFGIGIGTKPNVIDAWSGKFQGGSVNIGLPVLKLSVGAAGYRSPDNSLWGGAIVASVGINLIPIPADVDYTEGDWVPYETGTRAIAGVGGGAIRSMTLNHKRVSYVQYDSASSFAIAILRTAPAFKNEVALLATAIAVAKTFTLDNCD